MLLRFRYGCTFILFVFLTLFCFLYGDYIPYELMSLVIVYSTSLFLFFLVNCSISVLRLFLLLGGFVLLLAFTGDLSYLYWVPFALFLLFFTPLFLFKKSSSFGHLFPFYRKWVLLRVLSTLSFILGRFLFFSVSFAYTDPNSYAVLLLPLWGGFFPLGIVSSILLWRSNYVRKKLYSLLCFFFSSVFCFLMSFFIDSVLIAPLDQDILGTWGTDAGYWEQTGRER